MASPACPYSPDPLWQEQEGAMGKGPAERQVNPLGKWSRGCWGGGCCQRLQLRVGGGRSLGVICVGEDWCLSWLLACFLPP